MRQPELRFEDIWASGSGSDRSDGIPRDSESVRNCPKLSESDLSKSDGIPSDRFGVRRESDGILETKSVRKVRKVRVGQFRTVSDRFGIPNRPNEVRKTFRTLGLKFWTLLLKFGLLRTLSDTFGHFRTPKTHFRTLSFDSFGPIGPIRTDSDSVRFSDSNFFTFSDSIF